MIKQFTRSPRFDRSFKKLDKKTRTDIMNAIQQLVINPQHPSLRTSKMRGINVFYSRANREARITREYIGEDHILLRNCGHHDETFKNP